MKLNLTLSKLALLLSTQVASEFVAAESLHDTFEGVDNSNLVDLNLAPAHESNENHTTGGLRNFRNLVENSTRKLLTNDSIPCNSVIDTLSVSEIQTTLTGVFTNKLLGDSTILEIPPFISEKIPLLEHDIQMMKVCGSCKSESLSGYGCNKNDYGYDTTHSGLLLLPVDFDVESNTSSIIDAEELQTWIQMRAVSLTQADSYLGVDILGAKTLEYGMYAASMGLVTILPHKMGFGESNNADVPLVPSIVEKKASTTAILPLYAKAKSLVDEMTDGMTVIGNEVYFMGYSEGGYTAIAAADGFEKNGITPVKVMAGGAPIKVRTAALLGILKSLVEGTLTPNQNFFLTIVGVAFSDLRPGVPNFETGQPFLKPALANVTLALFQDKDAPISYNNPEFITYVATKYSALFSGSVISDKFDEFFTDALQSNMTDPCIETPLSELESLEVDTICKTLDENDLNNIVLDSNYDTELCHSKDDIVVIFENSAGMPNLKHTLTGLTHGGANDPCLMKFISGTTLEKPEIRGSNKGSKSGKKGKKGSKSVKKGKGSKKDKKSKGI